MFPHLDELRDILGSENDLNVKRFHDFDWRLNLVTATRARQKVMVPKYTVKLDLASSRESETPESFVFDTDYTNLKRIQQELEEAIKAIDATYSKKVVKFLK